MVFEIRRGRRRSAPGDRGADADFDHVLDGKHRGVPVDGKTPSQVPVVPVDVETRP
jgi:hypothetical protein